MSGVELPVTLPALVDYAGILVFAISGALLAAEKQQTFVTFAFFAAVTGLGGGTLRDVLIGAPVFWIHDRWILPICIAAALLVWVAPIGNWGRTALTWFDAVGLAIYASYGASKGLAWGAAPIPAFGMGVLTGCAGGIIRDVLAGDPSILLRPELYVTAAALSAGLLVLLSVLGVPALPAFAIATVAGFGLRAVAIAKGLSLPAYQK